MKILSIITHGNIGGATNVVYNLATGFKKQGIPVSVGFGMDSEYLHEKLTTSEIPAITFKHLKRTHNPFSMLYFILELRTFLKKNPYTIVHFHSSNSISGALGVKLIDKNIRTIFTFHGLSVLDRNYRLFIPIKWAYRLFFKLFLKFIDESIFVSKEDLHEAKRLGLIKTGRVIYNGLPTSNLYFLPKEEARSELEKYLNINLKNSFVIGSIGRLSYQKNYEFLIRVFPYILNIKKDTTCIVIGEGEKRTLYKELIEKNGVKNKFFLAGELPNAAQYLKAFDIFILPSRYEGHAITLIECLFANVPVLATNVGGNKEFINSASLYGLNNTREFLDSFEKLILDPSIYITKKNAKQFTATQMAQSYLSLYQNL